jgi:ATP-dependent DNA helicase RecQ
VSLRKWREEPASGARRRGAGSGPGSGAGAGRDSAARQAALADLGPVALEVFQRLRAWRAQQAQTTGVPAYVIFHDATLREIARQHPKDLDELGAIPGVGAKKLESYGPVLLQTIG